MKTFITGLVMVVVTGILLSSQAHGEAKFIRLKPGATASSTAQVQPKIQAVRRLGRLSQPSSAPQTHPVPGAGALDSKVVSQQTSPVFTHDFIYDVRVNWNRDASGGTLSFKTREAVPSPRLDVGHGQPVRAGSGGWKIPNGILGYVHADQSSPKKTEHSYRLWIGDNVAGGLKYYGGIHYYVITCEKPFVQKTGAFTTPGLVK